MKKFNLLTLVFLGSTMTMSSVYALDLDSGDYGYAPSGVNLAMLYYQHAQRDELYAGSQKVATNPKLTSDIGIARYVHYMDVAGVHVAPQVLVPFGRLDAGKDIAAFGSASGLGDIILATTIFLQHDAETKTTLGFTPFLTLPTGNYDKNDALNLGDNRYKLTLQGAYSTQIDPKFSWDVAADMTFYGKNDDIPAGGELKQDLGYQLQSSMRYHLQNNLDLRGGLSYADFGDTKTNGVKVDGMTQSKFWLGAAYHPTATTQLIATYGQDIKVENGFKEANRINLRLMKVF